MGAAATKGGRELAGFRKTTRVKREVVWGLCGAAGHRTLVAPARFTLAYRIANARQMVASGQKVNK